MTFTRNVPGVPVVPWIVEAIGLAALQPVYVVPVAGRFAYL